MINKSCNATHGECARRRRRRRRGRRLSRATGVRTCPAPASPRVAARRSTLAEI
jgi:hypothetical protein